MNCKSLFGTASSTHFLGGSVDIFNIRAKTVFLHSKSCRSICRNEPETHLGALLVPALRLSHWSEGSKSRLSEWWEDQEGQWQKGKSRVPQPKKPNLIEKERTNLQEAKPGAQRNQQLSRAGSCSQDTLGPAGFQTASAICYIGEESWENS
jgi:hypothetical protein